MSTKRLTIYVVILAVLGVATFYGIVFKVWGPNHVESKKEFQGASFELINEWITFFNSTNLYQYGIRINVTNTGQSSLNLSNLQINFTGTGRDKTWNTMYTTKNLVLSPDESKEISIKSQNVPASSLGFIGALEPAEYLDLATKTKNLGLSIALEGIASFIDESTTFRSPVKGLQTGSACPSDLVYARNLSNLGLTSRWLKRWLGTYSYLPVQDFFRYQGVQQGVIGTSKIPLIVVTRNVHNKIQSVSLGIEDVRTITVTDANPQKVYYLIDRGYGFETYLKDDGLCDGESVYFFGDAFDYLAQDGLHYEMLFLTDISATEMRDPLDVAKSFIVSRVGEEYYEKYYSDPVVDYNPGHGNSTHFVSLIYHISVGNYSGSQPIYLYFDPDWNLVNGAEYLPVAGNLQPFKLTLEQAKEIAINAGISADPYGISANIFCYNCFNRDTPTAYQGKYVWSVGTWIDPPGSNRRNIAAVIDPNTGELYAKVEGGVFSIGSGP